MRASTRVDYSESENMDKKYGDGSANPRSVLLTIKCTE